MSNVESFRAYYLRLLARFVEDATPWARDNIAFAALMFVTPTLAVYIRDRNHAIDWELIKTTLWLYLGALLIYVGYHAVRTPWKLSLDATNHAKNTSENLKDTIHALAEEILDFVYARVKEGPPKPQYTMGPFGQDARDSFQGLMEAKALQATFNAYEADTLGIYKYKYVPRVARIIKLLPGVGLSSDFLEKHGLSPLNSEAIKAVGDHLFQTATWIAEHENGMTKTLDTE